MIRIRSKLQIVKLKLDLQARLCRIVWQGEKQSQFYKDLIDCYD